MTVLFYSESDASEPWREAFGRAFPQLPFRVWPEPGADEAVRYALVWKPEAGLLSRLPNLKAIISLGAGVDHILRDPQLPQGVPIIRLRDAGFAQQMAEYSVYAVLHFQHRMPEFLAQQRQADWRQLEPGLTRDWRVGVMGLGAIGGRVAQRLAALGFPVMGWSRSAKRVDGIETFHGESGLHNFLSRARVAVNVLPLTPQTEDILDARRFAVMPRGAFVVNIGRGAHLVEQDLLDALDSGQLGGAMLDVFREEPLPRNHPFWHHPKIVVTPHVAGVTIPSEAEAQVIEIVRQLECGEMPPGLVDRSRGY
ncbi:MAG: glyoxylate/hydroxypyruvate reductase A [Burkholderiales bacterium]